MWFILNLQKKDRINSHIIIYKQKVCEHINILFSICITKHSDKAYLSHRGVASADSKYSVPIPCSWSTDITSPSLTSQMFIDALIPPPMADSSFEWLNTILNHIYHAQYI
jgi:hypothetical protein